MQCCIFLWQLLSFFVTLLPRYVIIAYLLFLLLLNSSNSNKVRAARDAMLHFCWKYCHLFNFNDEIHFNCIPPFSTFSEQQQQPPHQQQQPSSLSILDSLLKHYDRRATPTNHLGKYFNRGRGSSSSATLYLILFNSSF